jgi:hypothetical protein
MVLDPVLLASARDAASVAARSLIAAVVERNRPAVEKALATHDLSAEQIESQIVQELQASLLRLDALINGVCPHFG